MWGRLRPISPIGGCRRSWRAPAPRSTISPCSLGGIFKATGNAPPGVIAARGRWMNIDMARYAAREGITLAHNPDFPINTITLMRLLTAARGTADFAAPARNPVRRDVAEPAQHGRPGGARRYPFRRRLRRRGLASPRQRTRGQGGAGGSDRLCHFGRGAFGAPTFFVEANSSSGRIGSTGLRLNCGGNSPSVIPGLTRDPVFLPRLGDRAHSSPMCHASEGWHPVGQRGPG